MGTIRAMEAPIGKRPAGAAVVWKGTKGVGILQVIRPMEAVVLGMGAAFSILWGVADPVAAYAEVHRIEADGCYVMGEGPEETPFVAQERAQMDARRVAGEMAGAFLGNLSWSGMGESAQYEAGAILADILPLQVSSVASDLLGDKTVRYHCHMTAVVDPSKMMEQARRGWRRFGTEMQRNRELQEALERNREELEGLKARYAGSRGVDAKRAIQEQVAANEAEFARMFQELESGRRKIRREMDALSWNETGRKAYEIGNFEEAAKAFEISLDLVPGRGSTCLWLGRSYVEQGKYDHAISCCLQALKFLGPREVDTAAMAYCVMSRAYIDMEDYEQAVQAAEKAVSLWPHDAKAYINLGAAYYFLKRFGEAGKAFDQVLRLDPQNEHARSMREALAREHAR